MHCCGYRAVSVLAHAHVSMVIALPLGHLSRSEVNDCAGAAKVKRSRCTQLPGDVVAAGVGRFV